MSRIFRPAILSAFSLLAALPAYAAAPPAPPPYVGTLQANFAITLATPVPTGSTLYCALIASIVDTKVTLTETYTETSAVPATVTGSSASCTVEIPYSWALKNAAADKINFVYTIGYVDTSGIAAALKLLRSTSSTAIPAVSVPPQGWLIDVTGTSPLAITL